MRSCSIRVGLIAGLMLLLASPALAVPNIVLVVLDDLGACWIGKYTTDQADCTEAHLTPTIDTLAAGGVTIEHAWAQPNCSPFRTGMMTGTLPTQNLVGHVTNPEEVSGSPGLRAVQPNFLHSLDDAGYRLSIQGKWHMARAELGVSDLTGQILHPIHAGFEEGNWSMSGVARAVDGKGSGTYLSWEQCTTDGTCVEVTTYATTEVIDNAITAAGGSEPFYLYVPMHAPHTPISRPPVEVPALFTPHDDCDGDLVAPDLDEVCLNRMVEALDTELARLIAALPANTIVIVTADNGTLQSVALAEQPLWESGRCKGSVGECGLWVPLIVNGPGIDSAGSTTSTLVQAQDLHATILDMAGAENPGSVWDTGSMLPSDGGVEYNYRGVSFLPNLVDPAAASSRSCTYVEQFRPDATTGARIQWHEAIRNSTHKLMRHRDDGEDPAEECFLVADIRETVANRISLPDASCTALGLIMDEMHSGGDPCR